MDGGAEEPEREVHQVEEQGEDGAHHHAAHRAGDPVGDDGEHHRGGPQRHDTGVGEDVAHGGQELHRRNDALGDDQHREGDEQRHHRRGAAAGPGAVQRRQERDHHQEDHHRREPSPQRLAPVSAAVERVEDAQHEAKEDVHPADAHAEDEEGDDGLRLLAVEHQRMEPEEAASRDRRRARRTARRR